MRRLLAASCTTLVMAAATVGVAAPSDAATASSSCRITKPFAGKFKVAGEVRCGEGRYVVKQAFKAAETRQKSTSTVTVAPALGPWRCRVHFGDGFATAKCSIPKSSLAYRRDHRRGTITGRFYVE